MASRTTTRTIRNTAQLNAELRRLRRVPEEASVKLRDEAGAIAEQVAQEARERAGSPVGGVAEVAKYVVPTIRVGRDRVPVVRMGGSAPLPPRNGVPRKGSNQTVGAVMWGAEFGSSRSPQFSPWGGNGESAGYFLWPSIRMDEIVEQYAEALDRALDKAIG